MPSADEIRLWRKVTEDIQPLHPVASQEMESSPLPEAPPEKPGRAKPKPRPNRPAIAQQVRPQPSGLPELAVGQTAGYDKRNATRLKRGKLPIEDRLDLHGMTQAQAHRALSRFLSRSHEDGLGCVLVVTGKGLREDGSIGVLRSAVPRWLNDSPNREKIIAFTHATPNDGGVGALYIKLKRKR